jgi:hypothetical protein
MMKKLEMKRMLQRQRQCQKLQGLGIRNMVRIIQSLQSHQRTTFMSEQGRAKQRIAIVLLKEYELWQCSVICSLIHSKMRFAFDMSLLSFFLGQVRRQKISEKMKLLQDLVPGCNEVLRICKFNLNKFKF